MPSPGLPERDELFEQLRERIAVQRYLDALDGNASGSARIDPTVFGTTAATIEQSAQFARVGERLPSFDHLGGVRRVVARTVGSVALYFMRLVTLEQQRFNGLNVRTLRALNATARALHAELHALPDDLVGMLRERDQRIAHLENELAARDQRLSRIEEALAERDHRLTRLEEALADRDRRRAGLEEALADRDRRLARLEEALADRDQRLGTLAAAVAAEDRDVAALAAQQIAEQGAVSDLRASFTVLRAQLDVWQRRGGTADTAPVAPLPSTPPFVGTLPDALIAAEVLRGDEAQIAVRQQRYVECFAGRRDVLDVGCGRGEFLDLLRAAGTPARGVDADADMVLRCREKGLDVTCADALAYLAALPAASLGGLFCAQVVEHWQTPALVAFVDQAARTLAPGAPLVIETLNPESLLVIYRWFWADLTHERLVHPTTLQYLVRAAGFQAVECRYAPPPSGPLRIPLLQIAGAEPNALEQFNVATQYLNDLLYASYDYAVIAVR
jgi:SAM-dependent methyltransferase